MGTESSGCGALFSAVIRLSGIGDTMLLSGAYLSKSIDLQKRL
jgi:hypothetical protein